MALIRCVECGKQFSDKANACPECACPTEYVLKELEKQKSVVEYECESCGKHFSSDLDKCPHCSVIFEEEKKSNKKWACPVCNKTFVVPLNECPDCGFIFEHKKEDSKEERKKIQKFKCENCGTFFEKDLKKCPKCGIKFIDEEKGNCLKRSTTFKWVVCSILFLMLISNMYRQYIDIYSIDYTELYGNTDLSSAILLNVFLNVLFVSFIMMIAPVIYWVKNNFNVSYEKASRFYFVNSLILFIISICTKVTINYAFIGGVGAIVYYFINMTLFSNKKASN